MSSAGHYPLVLQLPDHGVGPEAESLRQQAARIWTDLFESQSVGQGRLEALQKLAEIGSECRGNDWDGYGSKEVQADSVRQARSFLLALPVGVPAPDVSAEADGEVEFEWYVGRNRLFSVSIGGDGILKYAGLFGRNEKSGRELFYEEVPQEILHNLNRLYSANSR